MKIDRKQLWGGFLLTLIIRGLGGAVLGAVGAVIFRPGGILRALAHEHFQAIGLWFALWSVGGGLAGMLTSPTECRPWYILRKRKEREQERSNQPADHAR